MKEQGFKYEFDETDHLAKHMLLFEDDIPVATCRFFFSVERDCYVIGRIAVSKEFRGKQYGKKMLQGAEKTVSDLGGKRIELSAQCRVAEFYKKQGYMELNDIHMDEDCPHPQSQPAGQLWHTSRSLPSYPVLYIGLMRLPLHLRRPCRLR